MNNVVTETLEKEMADYIKCKVNSTYVVDEMYRILTLPIKIKDALFLDKLQQFLKGVKPDSIESYKNFSDDDKKFLKENLLITIDKIESSKKIEYLIKIFIALQEQKISLEEYYRMNIIISNLSYLEIENFILMEAKKEELENFLKKKKSKTLEDFKALFSKENQKIIDNIKEFGVFRNMKFLELNGMAEEVQIGIITQDKFYTLTQVGRKMKDILKCD